MMSFLAEELFKSCTVAITKLLEERQVALIDLDLSYRTFRIWLFMVESHFLHKAYYFNQGDNYMRN